MKDWNEIVTIEKHGDWVKDDVDKILNKILTTDKELTLNVIKKKVFEELVLFVSQGITLNEKLESLVKQGVLKSRNKESNFLQSAWKIKVFSLKAESDQ